MPARATIHLTDADLIRHVDAEGDPPERARRETHLEACPDCAGRVRVLGRQSQAVHDWLVRTDTARPAGRAASPPPAVLRRRRSTGPWLKAAAIVLLLAAPLAAFPTVRDWVATRVGLRSETVTPAAARAGEVAAVIRFVPAPGILTVRIEGPSAPGTLTIGRAAGPEAELRGAGDDGAAAPIVSEDVVRIPSRATARYRLDVPPATTAVVIVLEGSTVRVPGAAIDRGRVVDLGD